MYHSKTLLINCWDPVWYQAKQSDPQQEHQPEQHPCHMCQINSHAQNDLIHLAGRWLATLCMPAAQSMRYTSIIRTAFHRITIKCIPLPCDQYNWQELQRWTSTQQHTPIWQTATVVQERRSSILLCAVGTCCKQVYIASILLGNRTKPV